jgi:uncharacterized protein
MDALLIDPFDFCRRNGLREGQMAVAELDRLSDAVADRSGTLDWRLSGGKGKLGRPQLTLSVKGTVQLICQRCLNPLAYEINTESRLILARDEEGADEIEEMLNDDTFDVIVGSSALDIVALVEDEALLALPLSPRHEVCPDSSLLEEKSKKESPFSVLQGLKK